MEGSWSRGSECAGLRYHVEKRQGMARRSRRDGGRLGGARAAPQKSKGQALWELGNAVILVLREHTKQARKGSARRVPTGPKCWARYDTCTRHRPEPHECACGQRAAHALHTHLPTGDNRMCRAEPP